MEEKVITNQITLNPLSLEWRRWLWLEDGATGWLKAGLVLFFAAGLWLVLVASLPVLVASVLSLAFVAVLFPYFLPVTYQVDETGVLVRYSWGGIKKHLWVNIESVEMLAKGYLLTVRQNPRPSKLFLPFPPEPAAQNILQKLVTRKKDKKCVQ
jgi:hypothetical protein